MISKLALHISLPIRGNEIADDLTKEAVEFAVTHSLPSTPGFPGKIVKPPAETLDAAS